MSRASHAPRGRREFHQVVSGFFLVAGGALLGCVHVFAWQSLTPFQYAAYFIGLPYLLLTPLESVETADAWRIEVIAYLGRAIWILMNAFFITVGAVVVFHHHWNSERIVDNFSIFGVLLVLYSILPGLRAGWDEFD